jgi:outer membrane protein OmpA-like peptidoglycan-associated protein
MKAVFIAVVLFLTGLTFYMALTQLTFDNGAISAQQAEATQASLDAQRALAEEVGVLGQAVQSLTSERDQLADELAQAHEDIETFGVDPDVEIGTLTQAVQNITAERDNLFEELSRVRDSFENKDAELNLEISTLSQAVQIATSERDGLADELSLERERFGVEAVEFDAEINALTQTVQTINAEHDNLVNELAQARAGVETKTAERDAALEQVATIQQEVDRAVLNIAELESALRETVPDNTDEQLDLLKAQISERDSMLNDLRVDIADLTSDLEARNQTVDALSGQVNDFETDISSLTARIAERDALVSSMEMQLGDVAQVGADAETQITTLVTALEERDTTIQGLQAKIAEAAAIATDIQTEEPAAVQTEISETTAQPTVLAQDRADQCVAQANEILAGGQVTFEASTAILSEDAFASLQRLSNLALDCQSDDLIIEIGVHTDSQGPEAKNQTLSEARAQAVLDYIAQLGLSPESMRAFGYGETQPIASNGSIAGREANRRVTFAWILR